MVSAHEQLFYVTVARGLLESILGGEAPVHLRRLRDLLHGKPRVPNARDVVRRRLRRHLRLVVIPTTLRPELRALFPARTTQVHAHRLWIDRVSFEPGYSFPTIDARAIVRLPMRRRVSADAIAALEAKHQDSLAWACSFEIDLPGDDTAWVVNHDGIDVIPIDRASDVAKLPRLPRETREELEYVRKVGKALAAAKAPVRVRR